jgi:hypothetical protein
VGISFYKTEMPKKGANMFEPPPVRMRRRVAGRAAATRTEPQLLLHIASLPTLNDLAVLKAQMTAEAVPQTKAVKKALYDQEQKIREAMQDEVTSPREVNTKMRAARRALSKMAMKRNTGLLFGPGTRRKSMGRRQMNANMARENAEFQAAIAEENARIAAANVPAVAPVSGIQGRARRSAQPFA